jgi:hypothetical protein
MNDRSRPTAAPEADPTKIATSTGTQPSQDRGREHTGTNGHMRTDTQCGRCNKPTDQHGNWCATCVTECRNYTAQLDAARPQTISLADLNKQGAAA